MARLAGTTLFDLSSGMLIQHCNGNRPAVSRGLGTRQLIHYICCCILIIMQSTPKINRSVQKGSAQPGRFGEAKKDGLGSTEGWSRRGSADGAPVEHPEVDRWLSSGASSLRSQVTVCRDYTYGKVHAFT